MLDNGVNLATEQPALAFVIGTPTTGRTATGSRRPSTSTPTKLWPGPPGLDGPARASRDGAPAAVNARNGSGLTSTGGADAPWTASPRGSTRDFTPGRCSEPDRASAQNSRVSASAVRASSTGPSSRRTPPTLGRTSLPLIDDGSIGPRWLSSMSATGPSVRSANANRPRHSAERIPLSQGSDDLRHRGREGRAGCRHGQGCHRRQPVGPSANCHRWADQASRRASGSFRRASPEDRLSTSERQDPPAKPELVTDGSMPFRASGITSTPCNHAQCSLEWIRGGFAHWLSAALAVESPLSSHPSLGDHGRRMLGKKGVADLFGAGGQGCSRTPWPPFVRDETRRYRRESLALRSTYVEWAE